MRRLRVLIFRTGASEQMDHVMLSHKKDRKEQTTTTSNTTILSFTMIGKTTTLLLLTLSVTQAFVHQTGWQKLIRLKTGALASVLEDSQLEPIDFDLERAKQCAEHFGECSVEEMEKLQASE